MHRWSLASLIVLVLIQLACSGGPQPSRKPTMPSPEPNERLLITDVSMIDVEQDAASPPQDILISGGKIVEVANAGTIARDRAAKVIDGKGLFAMPGLINVHAHIGDGGIGPQSAEDRQRAVTQFVRYGVTTIFVSGGGAGNDDHLARWKKQCEAGAFPCPDIYGSGALITAPGSHPIGTIWRMPKDVDPAIAYARGAVAVAEDEPVGPLLDHKRAMGVDAIKIVIEDGIGPTYPMPRLSKAKVAELVQAAHERGLRVFAHVSMPAHVEDGVAAGVDGVMHSAEKRLTAEVLHTMARQGTFYVATLALYDGFFNHALGHFEQEPFALAGVSERALASLRDEEWRNSPIDTPEWARETKAALYDNLLRASRAGVPLALGSDVDNRTVFPGYSAHEELALMVEAGLSPAEALAAATVGGAAFLEKEETLGKIAPGFEADLLLLTKNPLENILATRSLHTVLSGGRVVDDVVSTEQFPIIDMHLHAFGFDEYGDPPPPNEITGRRPEARSDQEAMAATFREMDRYQIVQAIASGPLEHVLAWQHAAPERMIGGAYTGSRDPLPEVSHLRQLVSSGKVGALGELGLQYLGLTPTDETLRAYFALAEELDLPVGIHTGLGDAGTPYGCCPRFRVTLGKPTLVEEILIRHPQLRIYLMHAGYPYLAETKALLYVYPQLYVDIAVINWALPPSEFHAYLHGLVQAGFGDRILFGSDQMVWPEALGMAVEGVESASFLTPQQKRDIFYNNAARFLGLSPEEISRHHRIRFK